MLLKIEECLKSGDGLLMADEENSISCDSKGIFEKENGILVVCRSVSSRQDSLRNFSQNVDILEIVDIFVIFYNATDSEVRHFFSY